MIQNLFTMFMFLLKLLGYPEGNHCKNKSMKYMKYETMVDNHASEDLHNSTTLVFEVEGSLLKSSSLFPYFMLVAFEGGGVLRGLVLFLFYPLVSLLSKEIGLKIMVFICFFGVKKDNFNIGRSVLPKFFLEDIGFEGFEVVMRCGRKVGVTELPKVMVEGFLKDYFVVDCVIGRDLKVVFGYFVGLMEDVTKTGSKCLMNDMFGEPKSNCHVLGFACSNKILDNQAFLHCKEIYLVSEAEKTRWRALARDEYPKPLIFHDSRLAFKPNFLEILVMIIWVPFGFWLSLFRLIITISLPYNMSIPILSFTGAGVNGYRSLAENNASKNKKDLSKGNGKGTLYVCNHRTLLDPIAISVFIMKPVTAVTYSMSRLSEIMSPLKTSRLSRNKEKDAKLMEMLLSQGDLVVCPEGTTCREPYVLRFSPLFAEIGYDIVPIALDTKVSMFYGTTTGGYKLLDPFIYLMNPVCIYQVKVLQKLPFVNTHKLSRIEMANQVQKDIAEALGFQCTNLTRKDKYMMLAGNEGVI